MSRAGYKIELRNPIIVEMLLEECTLWWRHRCRIGEIMTGNMYKAISTFLDIIYDGTSELVGTTVDV